MLDLFLGLHAERIDSISLGWSSMKRSHFRHVFSLVYSCSIAESDEGTWTDALFKRGLMSARSFALSFTLSRGLGVWCTPWSFNRQKLFPILNVANSTWHLFLDSQSPRIGRVSQGKNASLQTFHLNLSPFYDVMDDIKANMTSFRKQTVRSSPVSLMAFNPYRILETESCWWCAHPLSIRFPVPRPT